MVENIQENAKNISKWANAYSKNRTVPFLTQGVFMLFICSAMIGFPFLAGKFRSTGNTLGFVICLIACIPIIILIIWASVPKWGGKKIWKFGEGLYGVEGYATTNILISKEKKTWWMWTAGLAFQGCIICHFVLGGLGYIPIDYAQPVTAIYMIPFIAFLAIVQKNGFWPWIFITFYGLHAILILSGAPILFTGPATVLNVFIPAFTYMFISMFAGHLYSRYALKKLKSMASVNPGEVSQ